MGFPALGTGSVLMSVRVVLAGNHRGLEGIPRSPGFDEYPPCRPPEELAAINAHIHLPRLQPMDRAPR